MIEENTDLTCFIFNVLGYPCDWCFFMGDRNVQFDITPIHPPT